MTCWASPGEPAGPAPPRPAPPRPAPPSRRWPHGINTSRDATWCHHHMVLGSSGPGGGPGLARAGGYDSNRSTHWLGRARSTADGERLAGARCRVQERRRRRNQEGVSPPASLPSSLPVLLARSPPSRCCTLRRRLLRLRSPPAADAGTGAWTAAQVPEAGAEVPPRPGDGGPGGVRPGGRGLRRPQPA